MQLSKLDTALLDGIETAFGKQSAPEPVIGVAVSGGGDSMALLHLLHRWTQGTPISVQAVTVDHGLRKAAKAEAAGVAAFCQTLGIRHETLRWSGWDGSGNLQDQARRARLRLMTDWAKAQGILTIALGHTLEDQAETFLLRLKRGSGVDGLSGMRQVRLAGGIKWQRPLLGQSRQALRDYLRRQDIKWVDDPSNEDERFDRVKLRKAIALLAEVGISADRLARTAQDLQTARAALELQTQLAARDMVRVEAGDLLIDAEKFSQLPREIHSRLLAHALQWIASADYRPRRQALDQLEAHIAAQKSATLHGCRVEVKNTEIRIGREYQAVKQMVCPTQAVWDNRWLFAGPHAKGLELRALGGAGLAECADWRATGIPRATLLASPAIWKNQTLIAAPMAGLANEWGATALFGLDHFISSIISH